MAVKYFIVTEGTDTPQGYEVVEAKNHEDAIRVYREQRGYYDADNPQQYTVREVTEATTYNIETTVNLVPVVKKTRTRAKK